MAEAAQKAEVAATPSVEEQIEALVEGGALNLASDEVKKKESEEAQPAAVPAEGEEAPKDEPAQEPPKSYEFEWKGAKYEVPPELKELHEGYLRTEDYTRKTQEAADLKRSVEADKAHVKQLAELQQALQPQFEQLSVINMQLRRFQSIDWNKLTTDDPVEAQKQFIVYQQMKDLKAKAEDSIKNEAAKRQQGINDSRAKLVEEGTKILERKIKGWSSEKASALNAYVKSSLGFTDPEVADIVDPRLVEAFWKSQQWDALQASKPGLEKKVAAIGKTVKPQASQDASAQKMVETDIRRGIRSAKSDSEKAKLIGKLIESRLT